MVKFDGDLKRIDLVVYPTYVESQPRVILKAIALGIPVITTNACGISNFENAKIVECGNYEEIKKEIIKFIHQTGTTTSP